jgi:hypothetical protein
MFDKLKDAMRIMTAPVQSHKPLQLDEIVDATLQELKRQLAKAESALAASQQELARSDKARLFDKLKADNLQAMAEHFAERNTALESALAACHASHEHGPVAPEPNSQLKCDSCGNPVFEGHYSVLCHKPCCYDAATALVKAEASAINWHGEYIRVLEESQFALAASRAEAARLLKLFEFGEWIGSNDAADVVCDSTQEHLNTTEGYGLHLQYKIRLSRAEAESVLKRWEAK